MSLARLFSRYRRLLLPLPVFVSLLSLEPALKAQKTEKIEPAKGVFLVARPPVAGGGVLWELPGFLTPVWNVPIRFGYGVNLEPLPQESRDRFFLSLSLRF